VKLTKTQSAALELIQSKGKLHAYNGVSRATVSVLERAGLVTVTGRVHLHTNHRTGRTHSVADWTACPTA
jgi:hypothetical protein